MKASDLANAFAFGSTAAAERPEAVMSNALQDFLGGLPAALLAQTCVHRRMLSVTPRRIRWPSWNGSPS